VQQCKCWKPPLKHLQNFEIPWFNPSILVGIQWNFICRTLEHVKTVLKFWKFLTCQRGIFIIFKILIQNCRNTLLGYFLIISCYNSSFSFCDFILWFLNFCGDLFVFKLYSWFICFHILYFKLLRGFGKLSYIKFWCHHKWMGFYFSMHVLKGNNINEEAVTSLTRVLCGLWLYRSLGLHPLHPLCVLGDSSVVIGWMLGKTKGPWWLSHLSLADADNFKRFFYVPLPKRARFKTCVMYGLFKVF